MTLILSRKHNPAKPVFLDENGVVTTYAEGLEWVLKNLKMDRRIFAARYGYKPRSLEAIFQGRVDPPAELLNRIICDLMQLKP